jgi:hypothetical protein
VRWASTASNVPTGVWKRSATSTAPIWTRATCPCSRRRAGARWGESDPGHAD